MAGKPKIHIYFSNLHLVIIVNVYIWPFIASVILVVDLVLLQLGELQAVAGGVEGDPGDVQQVAVPPPAQAPTLQRWHHLHVCWKVGWGCNEAVSD